FFLMIPPPPSSTLFPYTTLFRSQGYTRKQWGMDPSELDKAVTARVPTRTNTDDRYFTDTFQAMPADGYTRMFERMLDHPNFELLDRKSTRLNSSHSQISYAVFCL